MRAPGANASISSSSALDNEIEQVRSEVKASVRRRDALTSALLSSRYTRSLASAPGAGASRPLNDVLFKQAEQGKLQGRRALLGTTLFVAHDPDPFAAGRGEVYGVRLERFSRREGRYLKPAYIFLRRSRSQSGHGYRWRVHRHTLPACVPVRALSTKYLPEEIGPDEKANGQVVGQKHDLEGFIKAAGDEAASLLRRREAIEGINAPEVKEARALNGEATDVRVLFKDGGVARLRLGKGGEIESVVAERKHVGDADLKRRLLSFGTVDALRRGL